MPETYLPLTVPGYLGVAPCVTRSKQTRGIVSVSKRNAAVRLSSEAATEWVVSFRLWVRGYGQRLPALRLSSFESDGVFGPIPWNLLQWIGNSEAPVKLPSILRQPPRDGVQHVWQQIITGRDQSCLDGEGGVTDATMQVMDGGRWTSGR